MFKFLKRIWDQKKKKVVQVIPSPARVKPKKKKVVQVIPSPAKGKKYHLIKYRGLNDYIEYQGHKFEFDSESDNVRVFLSKSDRMHTLLTWDSNNVATEIILNNYVFYLDPDKEEIIRCVFNREDVTIVENSSYKFTTTSPLKEWGRYSKKYNLNSYTFNGEEKKEDHNAESLNYCIEYSPEELREILNNRFKSLTKPCFTTSSILKYFRDGGVVNTDEKTKDNIYKYILQQNNQYGNYPPRQESETPDIKRIEKDNCIVYESRRNCPPPEYTSLNAKDRFEANKPFTIKEREESVNKSYKNNPNLSRPKLSEEEYTKQKEREYANIRTGYDATKKWIEKITIEEPERYGLKIGEKCESDFKRYFSVTARGYFLYKDIVLMFHVDGYGSDHIYEFKTCKQDRVKRNLTLAKDQANLYAYMIGKKKTIIEIFSYEEDKIHYFEYPVDKSKAQETIEKFYMDYKRYIGILNGELPKTEQTSMAGFF